MMDGGSSRSIEDGEVKSGMTFEMLLDWHREYHACLCDLMEISDKRVSEMVNAVEGSEER